MGRVADAIEYAINAFLGGVIIGAIGGVAIWRMVYMKGRRDESDR